MAIRFPRRRVFYVPDGSLSFCGKRKGGKNAAKTKVLESFSRLGCRPRRSPLTSRTEMCKICTLLSYGLCGAIRWPLTLARAALTQQGYPLRLPCYAQHFLSSFRRGRCPHRPALLYSLSPIGRGDHTSRTGIALQLMKKPCHCESAPRPWRSAFPSAAVFISPTAPFLSAAKEREERTPPKPRFWNPFRGWGVAHVGLLLPRGPRCAKFAPCFRMVSAAPSAGRSRWPALP